MLQSTSGELNWGVGTHCVGARAHSRSARLGLRVRDGVADRVRDQLAEALRERVRVRVRLRVRVLLPPRLAGLAE